MATEYIEKQAALDIVNSWRDQLIPTYGENDEYVKCLENVAELLESLHAADVRPVVRGQWIKVGGFYTPGGDPVWECSECGKGRHVYGVEHGTYGADISDGQWVACPNCRADMMGGDAEWESTSSTTPE